MVVDTLLALPRWVYLGVAVGVLMSVGVAATFAVAARLLPAGGGGREDRRDRRRSTEERRRAEIRSYLDAIDERYREDATVAEEPVAFYLPERDVAVTFDARTFLALERSPTHAILAEHEMPGVALRNRLPFETPGGYSTDDGRDARNERRSRPSRRPTPTPDEAAYAVLGLPEGASEDAVRRAYRERVKEVHPDQGGDEEEFRRVREAYDAARRQAR